jgi:hypothetical protein
MLFMSMSENRYDNSHSMLFPRKLVSLKNGKENRGDITITPDKGSLGFSSNSASTSRLPNP